MNSTNSGETRDETKRQTWKLAQKKRDSSSSRIPSSQGQSPTKEVSSLAPSSSERTCGDVKRTRPPVWPEWDELDVSAEKWDPTKGTKDGRAGRSPLGQLFEDPEGKVELPPSLKVHSWKRPSEYIVNKAPVVVENEAKFDLTTANEHLLSSELMRYIISEIYIVWRVYVTAGVEDKAVSMDTTPDPWRPWEHIYSLCKGSKGHVPLYNAYGKYVVRLYWMGCWRKITIDDFLPFDDKNNLLLPATTNQSELWPMLLAKAVLKLANTDVAPSSGRELRDFTVTHCLTGWIPELLPLQSRHVGKLWEFLLDAIPRFQVQDESPSGRSTPAWAAAGTHSHPGECRSLGRGSPQMVVCASYQPLHLQEKKISKLGLMADASQRLRQYGLSQLYSHPVLLTQTRACPLVAAPKTPPVPSWKLVRPRKERNVSDEPKETPVQKPEQYVEVASTFFDLRHMNTTPPLQLDPHQGGHRKRGDKSTLSSFDEADESPGPAQRPGPAQHALTCHDLGLLDSAPIAEVSVEDRTKDDSTAADSEAVETEDSSPPDKEAERVQTAKETGPAPTQTQDAVAAERAMLQETWVHLHDFAQCIQTLLVFHKPNTYTHHSQRSQVKSSNTSRGSTVALTNTAASTNSMLSARLPGCAGATWAQGPDEKGSHFLFVDSLIPTEILICFSALVHWGEEMKRCDSRPGVLTVKRFSWKSVTSQVPQVNIQTAVCKADLLSLPPGRHVFRIHTRAALGFHLQLYSMTSFVFGEEDTVMTHLSQESVRFCEQAGSIFQALGRVVNAFSDPQKLPSAARALENTLWPLTHRGVTHTQHRRAFNEALYHMFCSELGRTLTSEELLAIQALTGDRTLHLSNTTETDTPSNGAPQGWSGRPATEQEKQAATILQAGWRGYLERAILTAARPGTEENQKVANTLLKMWTYVELNTEKHAAYVLRYLITHSQQAVDLYPCSQDDWTRITFHDYAVPVPETCAPWTLLFREVFHVPKTMLLVPRIYSPLPACILHVINNDTGEETPRVFHSVQPHVYTQNKAGYTFVAEAYTGDTPLVGGNTGDTPPVGGKWRMRLIGSQEPLPQMARETPASNFSVKEMKDYYIPNEKNIICRCAVKVSCDQVTTVQFQTSNADVYVKLNILDHENEVASNRGKGHAIIPVFRFLANDDSSGSAEDCGEGRRSEDDPGRGGDTGRGQEAGLEDPPAPEHQPAQVSHKYIVQAELLYRSCWPLDDSMSAFIQTLRDSELNDMRVFGEKTEDAAPYANVDPPISEGLKVTTPKTTKKRDKDKDKPTSKLASRTEQTLDVTKPHWVLRVASEPSLADRMEVKKDTERLEEMRAIKQAWESAQPGRAAKALQSRMQFINKQQRPLSRDMTEGGETGTPETGSATAVHQYRYDVDYTPFIRRRRASGRLHRALLTLLGTFNYFLASPLGDESGAGETSP
ncbi:androglobin [Brachyhypopomus gauderio]|uniref:androglobin n=1 Tax=Brachyhypopomus gauderio TaxID=698409 RepID=UPI0040427B3B